MLLKSHRGARFYEPLHGTHIEFLDDSSENLDWFIAYLVLVVSLSIDAFVGLDEPREGSRPHVAATLCADENLDLSLVQVTFVVYSCQVSQSPINKRPFSKLFP